MNEEQDVPQEPEDGSPALREICEPEWLEWYRLSPQERWAESSKLWDTFLMLGGSLDPEPDYQSPFYDPEEWRSTFRGESVKIVRRSGV